MFAYARAVGFAFLLISTRLGLQIRMSGENPRAATTQGVDVARMRTIAVVASAANHCRY